MSRVVHFEVSAESVDRASAFYEAAFRWSSQEWEGPTPYRFLLTGPEDQPGIHGAVVQRESNGVPVVLTIEVPSLEETMGKVAEAGGTVLDHGHPIPGLGTLGTVRDSEGNAFTVLQRSGDGA